MSGIDFRTYFDRLLLSRGMTQRELAKRINVADNTIYNFKVKRAKRSQHVQQIANALDISVGELLNGHKTQRVCIKAAGNSIMDYAAETVERIHALPNGGITAVMTLRDKKNFLLNHINSELGSRYNLLSMSNWFTGNKNVPVKVVLVIQEFILKNDNCGALSSNRTKKTLKRLFDSDEIVRIKNI